MPLNFREVGVSAARQTTSVPPPGSPILSASNLATSSRSFHPTATQQLAAEVAALKAKYPNAMVYTNQSALYHEDPTGTYNVPLTSAILNELRADGQAGHAFVHRISFPIPGDRRIARLSRWQSERDVPAH